MVTLSVLQIQCHFQEYRVPSNNVMDTCLQECTLLSVLTCVAG